MKKKPIPGDDIEDVEAMLEMMNNPRTPADAKLARRIELTLMDYWYYHCDGSVSDAEVDEKDYAQFEAALDLYARHCSLKGASGGGKQRGRGLEERNANLKKFVKDRWPLYPRKKILTLAMEKFGPESAYGPDANDHVLEETTLGRYIDNIIRELKK